MYMYLYLMAGKFFAFCFLCASDCFVVQEEKRYGHE
jgi:hypothetical protein